MIPDDSLFDMGPPPPFPARFNMARHVLGAAGRTPDKLALRVLGDATGAVAEAWSYADLDRAIRATAAGLRAAGLSRGDRVALRVGNLSDFPILFFGTIAAGGVAVPTSSQLTAGEFDALLGDMRPRFAAVSDDLAVRLPEGVTPLPPPAWDELRATPPGDIEDTGADDPAFMIYTSGTSGKPRGVLHAQRSAHARRMMWQGWYGLSEADTVLHAGAFNWTYTLGAGLTDPWAAGASTLIYAGPRDAHVWPRLARAHGASIFAAVPGVYRQMLRGAGGLGGDFAGLRHGLTAGERMPEAVAAEWRAATGKPLYEALGMSEVSTYISSSPSAPPRPGASGRPQDGRRVAILAEDGAGDAPVAVGEPGLLAVSRRDPGLMLGYWNDPAATAAAMRGEWFLTGDRAAMDADGYITYLGRADEVMNALGYRVAPQEVEEAIARHPGVADVAVAELPVRADLALIAAFVVPRGHWPGDEALAAHAAATLAPYKAPKLWIAVESLPRSPNGKLQRRALVAAHRRDRT
ncbi:AMP-binding protein [Limibaculum sp. FT325]|uniref:class I adenylate-forming enzyme family protein n=1 Tax=Thermohalobaculum sediminis TaxID=2939436 RepID=UPI0020C0351E|nr:AMP-binding protein [Limibaculum sediminis]MCL5775521.1 AMP-binding protein [Limibaculum sediminis]